MVNSFEPDRSRARLSAYESDTFARGQTRATEHNAQNFKIACCVAIAHKRVAAAAYS